MATYDDARAGWELFRNSGFVLSLDDINDRLVSAGHVPISSRTYQHYRKLERYGYRRYVSINKLDVATANDPFVDRAIRSRYRVRPVQVAAQVVIHSPDGPIELIGKTEEISEFGASVVLTTASQVAALAAGVVRRGQPATLNVLNPPTVFQAQVEAVEVSASQAVVALEFTVLRPVSALVGEEPLPNARIRMVVARDGGENFMTDITRDVYWSTQAIELASALANELTFTISGGRAVVAQPRVRRLAVASPLGIDFAAVGVVATLLSAAIRGALWTAAKGIDLSKAYSEARRSRAEADGAQVQVDIRKAEARRAAAEARKAEAEADQADLETVLVFANVMGEIVGAVESLGLSPAELPEFSETRVDALMRQFRQAASHIGDARVQIAPSPSDQPEEGDDS